MSKTNYAIQIFTETNETDTSIGLVSGVFSFITGRLGYSGVGFLPSWGPDEWLSGNVSGAWNESWLIKDGMSNPSRQIDISKAGDYGTFSNFSFKVRNSSQFWTKLRAAYNDNLTNDINLINKEVRVYTVLNDVFYQIWNGAIVGLPRTDRDFIFQCEDFIQSRYHRDMPSGVISDVVVPVSIGDNTYIRAIPASGTNEIVEFFPGKKYTYIRQIATTPPLEDRLRAIYVGKDTAKSFALNELSGKYLRFIRGGTDTIKYDDTILVKIVGNPATVGSGTYMTLYTNDYFRTEPPIRWMKQGSAYEYSLDDGIAAHLSIMASEGFNNANVYVTVEDIDHKFYLNNSNITLVDDNLYKYDENTKTYDEIPITITNNGDGSINAVFANINADGTSEFYTPINMTVLDARVLKSSGKGNTFPATWDYSDIWTADLAKLTNKDQSISQFFYAIPSNTGITPSDIYLKFVVEFSGTLPDVDDIYVMPDFTCYCRNSLNANLSNFNARIQMASYPLTMSYAEQDWYVPSEGIGVDYVFHDKDIHWKYDYDDLYGAGSNGPTMIHFGTPHNLLDKLLKPPSASGFIIPETMPKVTEYCDDVSSLDAYWDGGDVGTGTSGYIKEYAKLNEITVDNVKNGYNNRFVMYYRIYFDGPDAASIHQSNFEFHQLSAFYANKSTVDNNLYAKVSTSTASGNVYSNNVYGAFQYILEENDRIPASKIDYGNMSLQRGNLSAWNVGRQIVDRKNSLQYIKELCQTSFTALYPTRLGKLQFNCWLDLPDNDSYTDSENMILRDSINSFEYTPIGDISNQYIVEYNNDIATKEYKARIQVTNTDKASFPSISGDWSNYVTGVSDYTYAKRVWENAASGYLLTHSYTSQPVNLQKLDWYNTIDSPVLYLDTLIQWNSRQHIKTSYDVALTPVNINRELTDGIILHDKLYTNDINYSGWITKVEYDIKNDLISLNAILDQDDSFHPTQEMIIIEQGYAPDQILESGSRDDIYIEN